MSASSLLAAIAVQAGTIARAVLEVLLHAARLGREGRAREGGSVPVVALARTVLLGAVGRVPAAVLRVRRAVQLLAEPVGLVADGGDGVAVDLVDAVAVAFFGVLVGDAAGEDLGHLFLVQLCGFGPLACVGDAAVFGHARRVGVSIRELVAYNATVAYISGLTYNKGRL